MISSLITPVALLICCGVLGYTAHVLYRVHVDAIGLQLAIPRGPGREELPAAETYPDGPRAQARRPRRKLVAQVRVAVILAAAGAVAYATGWNHHWPALACDAAAALFVTWLTRRRR